MPGDDEEASRRSLQRMLDDATSAAGIAARILAANAGAAPSPKGVPVGLDRALLVTWLSVFDRGIELIGELALRARERFPEDTRRWKQLGLRIHGLAEQSQAAALAEARREFASGGLSPHRFAAAAAPARPEITLLELRDDLRRRDAVLQYFVSNRYLIVFVFGRRFFDWSIEDVTAGIEGSPDEALSRNILSPTPATSAAEERVGEDVDALASWIKGGDVGDDAVEALGRRLIPPALRSLLEQHGVRHLRIVPHGSLYRVPFGRIPWASLILRARFTFSLHPTARLSAESARGLRGRAPWFPCLGFVMGPTNKHRWLDWSRTRRGLAPLRATRDTTGPPLLETSTSSEPPGARLSPSEFSIREFTSPDDLPTDSGGVDLLHFACHGGDPRVGKMSK
jgi:hypothetical protein